MTDILIPVWNHLDLTKRVIASVRENTTVPYQLIVVDDGSTDTEWLSSQNDILLVKHDQNYGFAKAINSGLEKSTGEYVVLLNNDVQVPKGWLKTLLEGFSGRIGAIGPLSTAQNQLQWQGNFGGLQGVTTDLTTLSFFCVVLKKEAIDRVGLMDERFLPAYGEDDDYCIRLRKANYTLGVHCDVVVEHDHGGTTGPANLINRGGLYKLRQKWGKKVWVSVLNQGDIRVGLANLLQHMTRHHLHRVSLEYAMAAPIAHNRNQIVKRFLESDSDYLLMIDSDTVPERNPLDLVIMDKDVVGLPTPVWDVSTYPEFPIYINVMRSREHQYVPWILKGNEGLLEVDAVGTGCMLIRREVLERVRAPFERFWDEDGIQVMGLDWAFCRKAKAEGFGIYTETSYTCSHWKTIDLAQVLSRIAANAAKMSREE